MRPWPAKKPFAFEEPCDADLELVLLTARWITVALIAVGLALFARGLSGRLWLLVLVAVGYNSLALVSVANDRLLKAIRLADPMIHGTLSVLGLIGSGGLDSIFLPLLPAQLAAICMLAPFRRGVSVGASLVLGFAAACRVLYPATDTGRLVLFTGFNLLLVWMIAALVRTTSDQRRQFLQVSAHELRTPMTAIRGIAALLREQAAAGQALPRGLLDVLTQETEQLSGLLTEVTEVFGLQTSGLSIETVPLDLSAVAAAAVEVAAAVDPLHTYVIEGSEEVKLSVLGDPRRLAEVFRNLLENSAKYSPPQTTVSVWLGSTGGRARAVVSDQGEGIPPGELLRVFQPFYRLDRRKTVDPGGMGLGLYICRQLVELQKGRIWAENAPAARGARFIVEFPLISQPNAASRPSH